MLLVSLSCSSSSWLLQSHLFKESVGLKMRSLRGVYFATAQCCTKCKTTYCSSEQEDSKSKEKKLLMEFFHLLTWCQMLPKSFTQTILDLPKGAEHWNIHTCSRFFTLFTEVVSCQNCGTWDSSGGTGGGVENKIMAPRIWKCQFCCYGAVTHFYGAVTWFPCQQQGDTTSCMALRGKSWC